MQSIGVAKVLSIINEQGKKALNETEPNMITKKKDGQEYEIQEGYKGRILPFEIVQKEFFKDYLEQITNIQSLINQAQSNFDELIDNLEIDEEEKIFDDEKIDSKKLKEEARRGKRRKEMYLWKWKDWMWKERM